MEVIDTEHNVTFKWRHYVRSSVDLDFLGKWNLVIKIRKLFIT